jgi:hypothetical protein
MEVVGTDTKTFGYIHYGGNNNLLPGRHEQQSLQLSPPDGTTHIFPALARINVAFINGNEGNPPLDLNNQPLGQLGAHAWVQGNTLVCWMRLTNNDETAPCMVLVDVNVLYLK